MIIMKKRKKFDHENFKKKIEEFDLKLWKPTLDDSYDNLTLNTWFNIEESHTHKKSKFVQKDINPVKDDYMKCKKIMLKLTGEQKEIIDRWMYAYIFMYNETIKFLRITKDAPKNFQKLRTLHLKEIRDAIIKKSQLLKYEIDTKIKTHIIDTAIKLVITNYKSAISNYKNGHIKKFRIRYWRCKSKCTMEIEPSYFRKGTLCKKILGQLKGYYNNKLYDFNNIKKACKFSHNRDTNEYYLYVPENCSNENINHSREFISLDPGIRTFMTGLSECQGVKIGDGCGRVFKNINLKIDSISSREDIKKKIKDKLLTRLRLRKQHLRDELHWKSISYLTRRYNTILIGDLSAKGIVNKKTSKLNKMVKRIAMDMSFYIYRQRLEYKCKIRGVNYNLIDESYTSKTCSCCGNVKDDLGSSKIYRCKNCKLEIDRDMNGCRNIYFKAC
jgi:IS605 OrfB family transposase